MHANIRTCLAAFLGALALAGCQETPDPAYCGISKTGYEHALTDVTQRLSDYQGCLSRAIGSDDCSAQFAQLSSAQTNLERGASDVQKYCPKGP